MPDLEFTCCCGKLLGTIAQDAGHAELEQFRESLEEKGYFAVDHAGRFCSKARAEAFFRRVSESHSAQTKDYRAYPHAAADPARRGGFW